MRFYFPGEYVDPADIPHLVRGAPCPINAPTEELAAWAQHSVSASDGFVVPLSEEGAHVLPGPVLREHWIRRGPVDGVTRPGEISHYEDVPWELARDLQAVAIAALPRLPAQGQS